MADIRIKDLTTTASSTASDDFIAVDGTTNGTRKLNAFSPTFGGNATVTGTLTANGLLTAAATTSLDGLPTAAIFGATKRIAIGYNTSGDYGFIASADSGTTWKELHLNPSGGLVKVPSTSASTTTSTGALVVGNGTSGGLGVGGSIVAGGNITLSGTVGIGTAASGDIGLRVQSTLSVGTNQYGFYSYPTVNAATVDGGFFGVAAAASSSVGSAFSLRAYTPTLNAGAAISTIFGLKVENHGAAGVTNAYGIDISAQSGASSTNVGLRNAGTTLLTNSTASTSTSSGALVVSGGVGVAGAIYAGGYASTASHARIGASGSVVALSAANNVDSGLPAAWNGNYGLGVYYSAASTNTILIGDGSAGTTIFATRTGSANTSRITIDNTNGNTTFAGAISIGNTVNTVSPTSPNRTITMVIGGTTYYLAAKTTND